jgi:hypothetical protein
MILKKQEKDNKVKAMYSSSNICASTYDKDTQALTIIFNNGGQYLYEGVSTTDYIRFEIADSQGSIFNSHIKKHSFQNLGKVDVRDILSEVATIKQDEDNAVINHAVKSMVEKMRDIIVYYDNTQTLESGQFAKAKAAIAEYETAIASKLDTVNG